METQYGMNISYKKHTLESAPIKSKDALNQVKEANGDIPSLIAVMANSPMLINGYLALNKTVQELSTLTQLEREVIQLSVANQNGCSYCVAAHSIMAKGLGLSQQEVERLLSGDSLTDEGLDALKNFALNINQGRGQGSEPTFSRLIGAGYTEHQALEVILLIAMKTITNTTNHPAGIKEDPLVAAAATN